jgi:hypothetical protein
MRCISRCNELFPDRETPPLSDLVESVEKQKPPGKARFKRSLGAGI